MGLVNSGDIDFSLGIAQVYVQHWGCSYDQNSAKSLAHILVGKCKTAATMAR